MRRLVWESVFVGALAAVTWLLLTPHAPRPPGPITLPDKLVHAAMFAVLAFTAAKAFPRAPRWRLVASLAVYGGVAELIQGYVGRTPDALDLLADVTGSLAAWLVPRERSDD